MPTWSTEAFHCRPFSWMPIEPVYMEHRVTADRPNISFIDLTNDATRIAGREYTLRDIPRDHTAGTNNSSRSDADTGKNQRTTTHPNVRTNLNWFPVLLRAA